jgi:hypothetical protein
MGGIKMTDTQETPEIVFTFTALDEAVLTQAEAFFGQDDVSSSKRMTGGTLIDVFIKPIAELIGKILDFKAQQGNRITEAKLVIGPKEIILEGYGVDDVLRLLNSEGFRIALEKLQS